MITFQPLIYIWHLPWQLVPWVHCCGMMVGLMNISIVVFPALVNGKIWPGSFLNEVICHITQQLVLLEQYFTLQHVEPPKDRICHVSFQYHHLHRFYDKSPHQLFGSFGMTQIEILIALSTLKGLVNWRHDQKLLSIMPLSIRLSLAASNCFDRNL